MLFFSLPFHEIQPNLSNYYNNNKSIVSSPYMFFFVCDALDNK